MATQKRRIVYLSDEEWAKVRERSAAFNLSISAYIGKLIEWRQPGPIYVETGERGKDPVEDPFEGVRQRVSELTAMRQEFRPVPKPSKRR